ncbi:MAG: cyclic nucleotide-binding domain-containing protein [Candidatus Nitrospinota bacterium M3_3B_026]
MARDPGVLIETLRRIHCLRKLSPPQLARIARLKTRHWGPDEFIFNEGDRDLDRMVVLLAGKVFVRKRVLKGEGETFEQVAELSGPNIVGDDSFFTGFRRSASVYARERVAGIQIEREDFNGLVSLDRARGVEFLKKLVEEGVQRAERTLARYISTLQIVMGGVSLSDCAFYGTLESFKRRLLKTPPGMDEWRDNVRRIMLMIREANQALEELYHFAHSPELMLVSVDLKKFRLSKSHTFYPLFKSITEELAQTQMLVSLDTINLKDVVISNVMAGREPGDSGVDYFTAVTLATGVYREFAARLPEMGFAARMAAPAPPARRESKRDNSLLWEDAP